MTTESLASAERVLDLLDKLTLMSPEHIAAMLEASPAARASREPELVDADRATRSPTIGRVVTALAKAQGAFPLIPRDRNVTVQPKPKRRQDGTEYWPNPYTYSYAPLPTILEKVRPALAENELALAQLVVVVNDKGHEAVRTVLYHSSGEFLANETPLFVAGGDNASQGYASGLTYARRYGVTTLLCIAADDDDDAENAAGEDQERATSGRRAPNAHKGPAKAATPPKAPQARKPAAPAAPATGHSFPGLSEGKARILAAKVMAAGVSIDTVLEQFEAVTDENYAEVTAWLTSAVAP